MRELLLAAALLGGSGTRELSCNTNFNNFHEAISVLVTTPAISHWAMVKADRGEDVWQMAVYGASVGSVETALGYGRYADVPEAEKVALGVLALNNQFDRQDLTEAQKACARAQSIRLRLVYPL